MPSHSALIIIALAICYLLTHSSAFLLSPPIRARTTAMADSTPNKALIASATIAAGAAVAAVAMSKSKQEDRAAVEAAKKTTIAQDVTPESFPDLPITTTFGSFENAEGVTIHTLSVKASTPKPVATVLWIHGVGEHCHRSGYGRLYQALSKAGVDVYSCDHQGHGLSGGERAYVERYASFLDDLEQYVRSIAEGSPSGTIPNLFICGQSMGANLAAHLALRLADAGINVDGLFFSSPMFGVDMDIVLKVQDFFGSVLDKVVPKAKLVDAVRAEDMSRDPKEVEQYLADPLIHHGNMKVHLALQLKWGIETLKKTREGISAPVLLMHGSDDKTTSLPSALDFFDNITTPRENKRMIRLVGMKHEVFNEFGKEAVVDLVVDFVTKLKLPDGDKPRSEGSDIEGVIEMDLTPPLE